MRADPKETAEPSHALALWLHESSRVFEDRLINDEDHAWFRAQQQASTAVDTSHAHKNAVTITDKRHALCKRNIPCFAVCHGSCLAMQAVFGSC